jgi:hypothetical protein
MMPRTRYLLPVLALLLALPLAGQEPSANRNIRFGMPGPASKDPKDREAFGQNWQRFGIPKEGSGRPPGYRRPLRDRE